MFVSKISWSLAFVILCFFSCVALLYLTFVRIFFFYLLLCAIWSEENNEEINKIKN